MIGCDQRAHTHNRTSSIMLSLIRPLTVHLKQLTWRVLKRSARCQWRLSTGDLGRQFFHKLKSEGFIFRKIMNSFNVHMLKVR